MNRTLAIIFGLIPAGIMAAMALVGLAYLDDWRLLLVPAAVVGFIGMGWAILDYSPGRRPLVLTMLIVGELAMGWGLLTQLVDLANPHKAVEWKALSMWLTLGPFVVGLTYIWQALLRRPPALSQDST